MRSTRRWWRANEGLQMATKKQTKKLVAKTPAPDIVPGGGTEAGGDTAHDRTAEDRTAAGQTLEDAAEGYLAQLDKDGAGDGTLSSYRMELKLAMRELGATTALAELSAERVAAYFASAAVTKTRSGKPKAPATIDKTKRVLRLALVWAADAGLLSQAPIPAGERQAARLRAI